MPVLAENAPVRVSQRVTLAAGLGALPAITAPPADGVAQVALAAITNANRAMREAFKLNRGGSLADGANLLQREFPRQNRALKADLL